MAAKKTKRARKSARKQTSDRVSRIAAKILATPPDPRLVILFATTRITWREVRALAASCLSQDEVRGKRGRA
jgi:hypothetical protein